MLQARKDLFNARVCVLGRGYLLLKDYLSPSCRVGEGGDYERSRGPFGGGGGVGGNGCCPGGRREEREGKNGNLPSSVVARFDVEDDTQDDVSMTVWGLNK